MVGRRSFYPRVPIAHDDCDLAVRRKWQGDSEVTEGRRLAANLADEPLCRNPRKPAPEGFGPASTCEFGLSCACTLPESQSQKAAESGFCGVVRGIDWV